MSVSVVDWLKGISYYAPMNTGVEFVKILILQGYIEGIVHQFWIYMYINHFIRDSTRKTFVIKGPSR